MTYLIQSRSLHVLIAAKQKFKKMCRDIILIRLLKWQDFAKLAIYSWVFNISSFFIQINATFVRLNAIYSSFLVQFFNWYNTTRATSEAGTAYSSGAPEFTIGVCDTRSLVLCVMCCWPLFLHLSCFL